MSITALCLLSKHSYRKKYKHSCFPIFREEPSFFFAEKQESWYSIGPDKIWRQYSPLKIKMHVTKLHFVQHQSKAALRKYKKWASVIGLVVSLIWRPMIMLDSYEQNHWWTSAGNMLQRVPSYTVRPLQNEPPLCNL